MVMGGDSIGVDHYFQKLISFIINAGIIVDGVTSVSYDKLSVGRLAGSYYIPVASKLTVRWKISW